MNDRAPATGLMSMTGFAAIEGAYEGWAWTADIRAVNGRSLELRLRVPDLEGLEATLRKRMQAKLGRGNVTVQIKLQRDSAAAKSVLNAEALVAALGHLAEIEAEAKSRGMDITPMRASDIAMMKGVLDAPDSSLGDGAGPLRDAVLKSMDACLEAFLKDRAREGAALTSVMEDQINRIEALTAAAKSAAEAREDAQKTSLQRALERLLSTTEVPDETRLTQELALIAVKTDVTEELDRLVSHVAAARDLMKTKGPVGRKLDFLMQEFNREANTLCSKAQSSDLTAIGLDLKTVIDQMREQVQNIE
ncbi:MAG: YicC/YloC family endoribonuclease [Paracoccaceae bacterium]|nr:YicC/YloC family endoribonuclease [Paracoccaceae bacterium]